MKQLSRHSLKRVSICVVVLCVSGCVDRFVADFEADTLGERPDEMPAGAPDDLLIINKSFENGSVTVIDDAPIQGARSLRLLTDPMDPYFVEVGPDDYASPTASRYLKWRGRAATGSHVQVYFADPTEQVRITFLFGDFLVNGVSFGSYVEGGEHTVLVRIDPSTKKFALTAVGDVSPGINLTGDILNPDNFDEDLFAVFEFIDEATVPGEYIIDEIRISERIGG